MALQLVGMSYSPFTEKARWALDHHGLSYRWIEHTPMIGEVALRIRARKLRGKVSAPLLIDDDGRVFGDSYDIARHADRLGARAPLFGDEAAIAGWNARSSEALAAGRALLIARMAKDVEAQREALPRIVPDALRPALSPVARGAAAFLARKYGATDDLTSALRTLGDALAAVRGAIRGRDTILADGFSYADVTMAVVLKMVAPRDDGTLPPATRRAWTTPELAREYADVVEWRDAIYAKHRRAA